MKKLVVVIFALLSFAMSSYGQQSIDPENYCGYWKSDGTTERIVVFKDANEHLQSVAWDAMDGEVLNVYKPAFENNMLTTTEFCPSTQYLTYNYYTLVNTNMLKDSIVGDGKATLVYFTRVK